MIMALYIIGLLLLTHGIYQLTKYMVVSSELKKQNLIIPASSEKESHHFFVLVPVLHEEKTIEAFLNKLLLQDYSKDSFDIYIITTEKEYLKNTKPNTIDILNRFKSEKIFSNTSFNIVHYPNKDGLKTHQLEYAFQQIRKTHGDDVIINSFFLFLDADSIVESTLISKFNNTIENDIEIYQQPLLWFKNLKNIKSPLMQSFAFQQSFFSISYEIPMFTGRFFPWRLKYFVGHGLCVKGSFLLRVGGFPDIIEDVRLGRISSFVNFKAKLVPGFGIVETAKNFFVYIKQSSVWFFGCGLFISDYFYSRSLRKEKSPTIKDVILLAHGCFKAFRWLNKGLLHLIGLVLSVIYALPFLLALFLLSLLINSFIPTLLVAKDFKHIWQSQISNKESLGVILRAIISTPILYMFNFIGVYYGVFKLINFYLWGKITLPKTDR